MAVPYADGLFLLLFENKVSKEDDVHDDEQNHTGDGSVCDLKAITY